MVQSRISSFGIQSHHHSQFRCSKPSSFHNFWRSEPHLQFQRSEPPSFLILAFRATLSFLFSVHSRIIALAFRVVSSVQRSKSLFVFSSISRVAFLVSAFGAIIASQFRHSEPSSLLSFGCQSHHFSVSAFRAILIAFSISVFRAIITSQFDVQSRILNFGTQSHHHFPV